MSGSGFFLEDADGVLLARCGPLEEVAAIAHAFSTRRADGVGVFDLGSAVTASAEGLARRRRFLEAAGTRGREAAVVKQVHGARAVRSAEASGAEEADIVLWVDGDPPHRVPSVRTADCVPILIADRAGRAAAAVHAGWRGTAAGAAARAVEALARFGVEPGSLVAALGPAILGCCYEVGPLAAEAVSDAAGGAGGVARGSPREGRFLLDLHAANRWQLEGSGVEREAIHVAPWCTHCRPDLFFSYRRDGAAAGRMMASIGAADPSRRAARPRPGR